MAPKLTHEMKMALQQQPGTPLEVVDDEGTIYVVVPKATFTHLREACRESDDATRADLRRIIEDGIDSGPGIPGDQMFAELRQLAVSRTRHET